MKYKIYSRKVGAVKNAEYTRHYMRAYWPLEGHGCIM